MRRLGILAIGMICILLATSCGSEAYREYRKNSKKFEKQLNRAKTLEDMQKAHEYIPSYGNQELMTKDEQYKLKKEAEEHIDLWESKIGNYITGTYTFTCGNNNYKIVIKGDGNEYCGNASVYKNGTLVSDEGKWCKTDVSSSFLSLKMTTNYLHCIEVDFPRMSEFGYRDNFDLRIDFLWLNAYMGDQPCTQYGDCDLTFELQKK